jgi:hypothetical protein
VVLGHFWRAKYGHFSRAPKGATWLKIKTRKCVEQNGIQAALDVNGLDRLQGLRVPYHDGLTAGEPVLGFRIDDAVRCRVGDFARRP